MYKKNSAKDTNHNRSSETPGLRCPWRLNNLRRPKRMTMRPNSPKRGLRANGLSLLPLALRPGLRNLKSNLFCHQSNHTALHLSSLIVLSVLLLGILAGTTSNVSASSMTLTLPGSISLNISPTSEGSFAKSETAEISAKTDSITGYTLSIKSKETTDSNCLKNGTNKIESIDSKISEADYKSSGKINTWAFQPTKYNSLANTDFLPAPTSSESVIDKTLKGNDLSPNKYGIVLATKVNTLVPTGIYSNTEIVTMASNAMKYTINYNPNGGSGGPSSPQSGTTEGNSFTLASETPTLEGKDFKGWCTVQPTEDGTCNGGTYQPGGTYNINCDSNDLTLWAMWRSGVKFAQDFSCNLDDGETTTITDSRDGNNYTVAKLKDGKCWMTQNLRLGDSKLTNRTLFSANTNITSNYTLPASSTSGFSDDTAQNVYVGGSYNSGYYTWNTATAGTGASISSGEASGSICPKGWRLPNISEFQALYYAYGSDSALLGSPVNLVLSGEYSSSWFQGGGSFGDYWSSTASASTYAYNFRQSSSSVTPVNISHRYGGFTIRCISER